MNDYTNVHKERYKSLCGDYMVSSITINSNEMSEEDLNRVYNELIKLMSGIKRISNE